MNAPLDNRLGWQLEYVPGGSARIARLADPPLLGAYGIAVNCWLSLVNAGTDRIRLRRLRDGGGRIVPTGVAIGRITAVGAVAAQLYPNLAPDHWIVAKAPHASRLRLDVLVDDFVCVGPERPAANLLLARYANIARQALHRLPDPRRASLTVLGLGPLGHMCMRLAERLAPARLIGIDRHPVRRALIANVCSATSRILPALPPDEQCDALIVAATLSEPGSYYLSALRDCGRLILLAAPGGSDLGFDAAPLFRRSLGITSLHERHCGNEHDGRTLIASGIEVLSSLDFTSSFSAFYLDPSQIECNYRSKVEEYREDLCLVIRWDE